MFRNRFFRKLIHENLFKIDQVKLVYFLSLLVGLLSALAAAILKYSIHYTHKILTEGITTLSGNYTLSCLSSCGNVFNLNVCQIYS